VCPARRPPGRSVHVCLLRPASKDARTRTAAEEMMAACKQAAGGGRREAGGRPRRFRVGPGGGEVGRCRSAAEDDGDKCLPRRRRGFSAEREDCGSFSHQNGHVSRTRGRLSDQGFYKPVLIFGRILFANRCVTLKPKFILLVGDRDEN
jgi:hypothetical protein